MKNFKVIQKFNFDYNEALKLQTEIRDKVKNNEHPETLIFCTHPPTITIPLKVQRLIDNNSDDSPLKNTLLDIQKQGVTVAKTNRGGNITYHSPKQLTCYSILDLKKYKRDVAWYMRTLEGIIIETLKTYSIDALTLEGLTGVWVKDSKATSPNKHKKIASIGVKLSRWVSMHGFSLCVYRDDGGFNYIEPCGIKGCKMTSIEEEASEKRVVKESLVPIIIELFNNNFA